MIQLLKINPNFGSDLFNILQPILFYISFICIIVALISSINGKKNIAFVLAQLFISTVVLFAIHNPYTLVSVGEFTFGFLFSLLKEMELKEEVAACINLMQ